MAKAKKKIADPNAPYGTLADGSPRKKPGPPTVHGTPRSIRVSDAEWEAWHRAAKSRGSTVSDEIRRLMNESIKLVGRKKKS